MLVLLAGNFFTSQAQLISTIPGSSYGGKVAIDKQGNYYVVYQSANQVMKLNPITGVLSNFAGTGTAGFGGDNGPASAATLNVPRYVAVDTSNGDVYIGDGYNIRVRKVSGATGVITTFAGNGAGGFSGDGGPATAAELGAFFGIAVDPAHNVFIADNYRVRRIDGLTGIITTFAGSAGFGFSGDGGPATAATLYNPQGLCFDRNRNLYIADWFNYRIRKVDTSGIITTVAGNGAMYYTGDGMPATASAMETTDVATDYASNIYIADRINYRIRMVDHLTGIITTVAGTGTAGFSGDGGPATAAQLNVPTHVTIDSCANIIISDFSNYLLRKVTVNTYCGIAGPITLAGDTLVCPGGNIVLTATPAGGAWNSLSPGIAIIGGASGIVTGIAPGTALITYSYGTVTDTIFITVGASNSPGIISGTNILCVGDTTTLSETFSGGIWSISNSSVATISSSGLVTGISPGMDTVRYTIPPTDFPCSATTTFPITVKPHSYCLTGVDPGIRTEPGTISVAPNPVHNTLCINAGGTINHVMITNMLGQEVYSGKCSTTSLIVDVSGLPGGMYLVKINGSLIRRFVKE